MSMTGADLLIHLLEREGVRIVAGIPGGAVLPLYAALGRSSVIRHVLARHEQGAGFIAQGMARITGRAGVCFATSGPGITNVITALADAKLDSVPLVCIAGQVPIPLIGTDAFQEVPTIDIVRPITKGAFFIRKPADLAHVIPEAFRLAEQGRPGPVLVDVPKDVQLAPCGEIPEHAEEPSRRPLRRDESLYDRAIDYVNTAARPVLYVGGGVISARATEVLRTFAERAAIPVTTTLMALGAMPAGHPLNIGMLGMHGARYTNQVLDECDLLVCVGARFDDRATGRPETFAPLARIVHIDIDAREFGKIKTPTLAIQDDAMAALQHLLQRTAPTIRPRWLARVAELRGALSLVMPDADDVCSPYGIIRALGELADGSVIVATDVGQHQMWTAQAYPFARAGRWLTSGGLGTMGFGLPAAIGAALAEPCARVLCITGDGSLLMNLQELATLAELDLDVKVIVLDNGSLGLVRQQQELFYGGRFVASQYARPTDFVALARAFELATCDLAVSQMPAASLAQVLAARGPALIRVPIAAEQQVLPMVAPGAANTEAVDHPRTLERTREAPDVEAMSDG